MAHRDSLRRARRRAFACGDGGGVPWLLSSSKVTPNASTIMQPSSRRTSLAILVPINRLVPWTTDDASCRAQLTPNPNKPTNARRARGSRGPTAPDHNQTAKYKAQVRVFHRSIWERWLANAFPLVSENRSCNTYVPHEFSSKLFSRCKEKEKKREKIRNRTDPPKSESAIYFTHFM